MEEEVGGDRNRDQSASYAHYSGIYLLFIRLFSLQFVDGQLGFVLEIRLRIGFNGSLL